jgi:hypothetical protein
MMGADLDLNVIDRLTSGRLGTHDVPCPLCGRRVAFACTCRCHPELRRMRHGGDRRRCRRLASLYHPNQSHPGAPHRGSTDRAEPMAADIACRDIHGD